jgi:hypothetical protein
MLAELLASDAARTDFKRDLSLVHERVGDALLQAHDVRAREAFAACLTLRRELVARTRRTRSGGAISRLHWSASGRWSRYGADMMLRALHLPRRYACGKPRLTTTPATSWQRAISQLC